MYLPIHLRNIPALVVLLSCRLLLPAQTPLAPIVLTDQSFSNGIPLEIMEPFSEQLEDKNAVLPLEQVKDSVFTDRRSNGFRLGYEHKTLWVRFKIVNLSRNNRYVVEVVNPFIPGLTLYQLSGNDRSMQYSWSTGVDSTFRQRNPRHRNFQFPVTVAAGDSAWFYLALAQDYLPYFNLLITEREARLNQQQRFEDILLSIFFVFCALYLILSAILFSVTRQTEQWYYFTYVLLTALFIQGHMGLGYRYIWPDWPVVQYIAPQALNMLRLVFGLQFFRLYFRLEEQAPNLNRFVRITIYFFLLTPVLQATYTILRSTSGSVPVAQLAGSLVHFGYILFSLYLSVFGFVLLAWLLREAYLRRLRRASWLLLVLGLNFIGITTIALQYLGFNAPDLANYFWGQNGQRTRTFFIPTAVMAAFFIEMVLVFYFSLRRYIRMFEKEQKTKLKLARAKEEGLQALVLAIEAERRRIARDLHDGACVNLAAIRLKIDGITEQMPESRYQAALQEISEDLEWSYREVRSISHDLMSKSLEKTDLVTALEQLTSRTGQLQPGLQIQFYSNLQQEETSTMAKIQVYRIVQELLANVLKHAAATTCTVQLLQDGPKMLLTVEDDGKGFDKTTVEAGEGIGLQNIRTRVAVLRGNLHLESTPGNGCFVCIDFPESALQKTD